jgi:uncharacterized protein YbjT (DUF2867 family)
MTERLSAKLRRIDDLAAAGASLAEIAAALRTTEWMLLEQAETYLTGRCGGLYRNRSLAAAAKALGLSPAQMLARILRSALG